MPHGYGVFPVAHIFTVLPALQGLPDLGATGAAGPALISGIPGLRGLPGLPGLPDLPDLRGACASPDLQATPRGGLAAYGGNYNSEYTAPLFTQADEYIPISLNTTMPALNVSYPAANSITVSEAGDYEITYNLLLNANQSITAAAEVRRNGAMLQQYAGFSDSFRRRKYRNHLWRQMQPALNNRISGREWCAGSGNRHCPHAARQFGCNC